MAYDYDALQKEQDRDFTIRGETFTIQTVRPEVIAAWADDEANLERGKDSLKWIDDQIKVFLDSNGSVTRWEELRAREKDAVTQGEMEDILRRMVRVNTQLPTEPSSPSAPGRGRTAASSKAG